MTMERTYATQMEAARKGIVTPELEAVAKKERMTTEELLPLVAAGKAVIPANRLHTWWAPCCAPRSTSTWASPGTARTTMWRCRR